MYKLLATTKKKPEDRSKPSLRSKTVNKANAAKPNATPKAVCSYQIQDLPADPVALEAELGTGETAAPNDGQSAGPMSAEAGLDAEDARFVMPGPDPEDQAPMYSHDDDSDMGDSAEPDLPGEDDLVDMLALMDVVQTCSVDLMHDNRCVTSVVRRQPYVMEVHGRGRIDELANSRRTGLNALGDLALDVRANKPSGERWDFTKKSDRMEALELVKIRKPRWVVGSHPCTAFSTIMALMSRR